MSARASMSCLIIALLPALALSASDAESRAGGGRAAAGPTTSTPRPAGQSAASLRNFSGMWMLGEAPSIGRETLKPEFAARFPPASSGGPAAGNGLAEVARQCVPSPLFGTAGGYPLRIVQTATQVALLSEENNRVHRIYLDRDFPDKLAPTYAGMTVGHWEGNTLVAETRGLRFAPGAPTLPDYRVIERLRRGADGLTLEQDVIVESSAFATAARRTYRYFARPDLHWQGGVCEEQPAPLPSVAAPARSTP
jgi:hypothetical protein